MLCNVDDGPLASEVAADEAACSAKVIGHAANGVAGDDLAAEVVAHKPDDRQLMRAFIRSLRRQLGDDSKSRLDFRPEWLRLASP